VVDIQETPAVPPMDTGGDERAGCFLAGGMLIFLGWGLGVLVNVSLHMVAGAGGLSVAGIWFGSTLGTYAWAALGFGVLTGLLGVGLLFVGRTDPKGPLVLPG
jgi:hypothetical protein